MEKVIIMPDSFKGTMSSIEVCQIIKDKVQAHFSNAKIITLPVADGGEGTVDCFLSAVGGKKIVVRVKGPYLEDIDSFYGLLPDQTAVIEMAACAGLPLVADHRNPLWTSTYGVGQLIGRAIEDGCQRIILGLGGSCTNDGGAGALSALGVQFIKEDQTSFVPTGGTLSLISQIDCSGLNTKAAQMPITIMCDVDNPMCGKRGATYVFAPQKGATSEDLSVLESGMVHYGQLLNRHSNQKLSEIPGTGAAGAMGGGVLSFLNATLKMGIDTVLDVVDFESLLPGTDLIISGEGKLDQQTLAGKVVVGIARRIKDKNIPYIAIVGDIGDNIQPVYDWGLTAVFSINRIAADFSVVKSRCQSDLSLTVDNIMRFYGRIASK